MLDKVFADSSALLAIVSKTDSSHARALKTFEKLRSESALLLTTSYVLVETYALLHRRHGKEAARRFREEFSPILEVVWVHQELHERAMEVFLESPPSVSLVDAVSFVSIRDLDIEKVWAIDRHFDNQGFEVLP